MVTFHAMGALARSATILRLNLALTCFEGIWTLWYYLKLPSETSSMVFLQYSRSRLVLLLFVLLLLAGILFLLAEAFRPNWHQRTAGKWLQTVMDENKAFWFLLACGGLMYFLTFISIRMVEGFIPYHRRILPIFLWLGISSIHWLAGWIFLQSKGSRLSQSYSITVLPAGLLILFFVSRAVYDRLGFTFQSEAIYDSWQLMDPLLLHTDLWRSVWYLHSQPPMLNLFTGLVLQYFPSAYQSVFHAAFLLAGMVLTWSIYRLGLGLGLQPWLSFIGTVLFMISPPVVLYEHWLFYTYPIAVALALSGVALHRFQYTHKLGWGVLFFSVLAFITLSWSLFHLLWLIVIVGMLLVTFPARKKVFFAALIPITLVGGWYGKNQLLFGEFTASTWAGMNLSHPTTLRLPDEERLQMVQMGKLSPFAQYESFSRPQDYLNLLSDTPSTGIPLLDAVNKSTGRINFHHIVYVEAADYYRRDALIVMRTHPTLYLRSIAQSLYIFFHSASDYDFLDRNRLHISAFETGWNRVFFGQWEMNETLEERTESISVRHIGWWIVPAFLTALFGSARYLWKNRRALNEPKHLLILFMSFNLAYVALAGNLFDLGENNRFRFAVDPFILLLFLFVIMNNVQSIRDMTVSTLEHTRWLKRRSL